MAKVHKSYRAESRKDYGNQVEEGVGICIDQLKLGSLFRIADALEKNNTIMVSCETELSSLRYHVTTLAEMPRKTCIEIQRLKRIVKQQKAEIAQLKELK